MQLRHPYLYRRACLPHLRRRAHHGLTLVEMLVAGVILAFALMGLVETWLTMMRSTITTEDRSAGYECARMVLERARVNGFSMNGFNLSDPQKLHPISAPDPTDPNVSQWSSPNIVTYRFYSPELQELAYSDTDPTPPAGVGDIRYRATTMVRHSDTAPRSDLNLELVSVTVNLVNANGTVGTDPLCQVQTFLTEGGIQ